MHIRGWTILAVSILSFLILLYIVRIIQRIHERVEHLNLTSDKSAMGEAVSAHDRLDRIDGDMKADQHELSLLRIMINAVKGQVQFLLHKDISAELSRQVDKANRRQDDDGN